MLIGLNEAKEKLIERGEYYILQAPGMMPQDLPEFSTTTPVATGIYWDKPRAASSHAGGLLCYAEDNPEQNQNVMVHEMVHMIHIGGIRQLGSTFDNQLADAYNSAMNAGLWSNTAAAANKEEYLAYAVQIYFEVGNPFGSPGGDGAWNDINTRVELQNYDPAIYNIVAATFNNRLDVPGCIQNNVVTPYVDETISCPTTVTDIDGNTYNVVRIGNQCWFAENLKTTKYKDGSAIEYVMDSLEWIGKNSGAYAFYQNDLAKQDTYGNLYNWYAISSNKGLCPDGWRVATPEDWSTLSSHLQQQNLPTGGPLKSTILWEAPNEGATNSTGFNALPAGLRNEDGHFTGLGGIAMHFSPLSESISNARSYNLYNNGDFMNDQSHSKNKGTSCRCIKE
jgi:uncharacterized protein (TIGR02145 family)